jgi:hypothetical protein
VSAAPREGPLRRARRAVATVVWLYGPLAVGWPVLLAAGLWRRLAGRVPAPTPPAREVSPYRVADPPAWDPDERARDLADRAGVPYVPLPGPPKNISK